MSFIEVIPLYDSDKKSEIIETIRNLDVKFKIIYDSIKKLEESLPEIINKIDANTKAIQHLEGIILENDETLLLLDRNIQELRYDIKNSEGYKESVEIKADEMDEPIFLSPFNENGEEFITPNEIFNIIYGKKFDDQIEAKCIELINPDEQTENPESEIPNEDEPIMGSPQEVIEEVMELEIAESEIPNEDEPIMGSPAENIIEGDSENIISLFEDETPNGIFLSDETEQTLEGPNWDVPITQSPREEILEPIVSQKKGRRGRPRKKHL